MCSYPLKALVVSVAVLLEVQAMRRRPTRPLPSRKGWIVSNCTCASAALTRIGVGSGSS
jgi:hypothetical protein